jgi:glycosyltransferase involved in cell wall biosynthesis
MDPLMADLPRVSVVTPSFNQAVFLERTILSVLEQEYPNLEYIIIDGGSTDGSVEIIQKYADRLAYWISEPDRGQTDAINKGFSHATGDILAWLNSDDTYLPGALAGAASFLQQNGKVGLVYGDMNFIDEHDQVIGKFNAALTDLKRLRRGYIHVPQPAAFIRADLWRQVGPLDPTFFFAMDYDLWVRLAQKSDFAYLKGETWANFRLHSGGKTVVSDDRNWPELLRVHYRDGGSFFSPIVARYWLRKLLAPYIHWRRRKMFDHR